MGTISPSENMSWKISFESQHSAKVISELLVSVDILWSFCATGQQRSYLIILTCTLNIKASAAIRFV